MTTPIDDDGTFTAPDDAVQLDPSGNTFDHDDEHVPVVEGHGPVSRYAHHQSAATMHVDYGELPAEPEPVTVRVVDTPPPPTMRRRFIAVNIPVLVNDSIGFGARRVLPQRFNRSKARITVKAIAGQPNGDRVWVSQDESPGNATGIPLDDRETFETNTTEDVWVALDPQAQNGALICVYAEYLTELHEHAPGDKRHAGTKHGG